MYISIWQCIACAAALIEKHTLLISYRLSQVKLSGMVHIMDMLRDMTPMDMQQLLRTLTCIMQTMQDMQITSSLSR